MRDTMTVFISTPMSGLTENDIRKNILHAKRWCESVFDAENKITFFDSLSVNTDVEDIESAMNLDAYYLGRDICAIAKSNAIVFTDKQWWKYRGCSIEHMVADMYQIPIYFM